MKYSLAICMLLVTTTSAIRLTGDDKGGEKKELPNMGRSSDVAFQAGRVESAGVVAA